MKSVLDKFSAQAGLYKKYRPVYPQELYDEILKATNGRNHCWDCGTGNGQVAKVLAKHFKSVEASDISRNQISNAERSDNITYHISRAEKTLFKDNQFDLVTVAQALHWFDISAFFKEVKRVCKNNATLSVWGYGLIRIDEEINALIDQYYHEITGPYWNKERNYVDQQYNSIPFDFQAVPTSKSFSIQASWDIFQLEGYFKSWSAVQNYLKEHQHSPVDWIMEKIKLRWDRNNVKQVNFPIFMKMGRVVK